jgi:hypothetical protein
MDVFNEVERDRYWIDGVKPITALVWYALAYDFAFAARSIATLIRALPGIFVEGVLDAEDDPRVDLVRQLEDPDRMAELAERYESNEVFRVQFNAEVAGLLSPAPQIAGADTEPVSSVPDPVSMGDQIRARVHSCLHAIARLRAAEEGARLVVFGHTHDASVEPLPNDGLYINSGTWTWRADFSGAGEKTWRDLFRHPERYTDDRLFSYVRVDYDEDGQPLGQLLAYDPSAAPEPDEGTPEHPPSPWDRFLAWWRGLWARLAGS